MGRVYGTLRPAQTKTPETEVPGVSIIDNLAIHVDIVFSGWFGGHSFRLAPVLLSRLACLRPAFQLALATWSSGLPSADLPGFRLASCFGAPLDLAF